MSKEFIPGPVSVSFRACIDGKGEPFIEACFGNMPEGIKIVGNGTLPHPLNVKISGEYAAAPEMLEALEALEQGFLDGSIAFTTRRQSDSDPYHPASTLMTAALAKARSKQ